VNLDTLLLPLVLGLAAALLFGLLFEKLRQPAVVGYIVAGLVLGHFFGRYMGDKELFAQMGEVGLMLLLFFIGTEAEVRPLLRDWKISVVGTGLQVLVFVGLFLAVGWWFHWPVSRSLFFGFALSLSSSAVVLKILEEFGGTRSIIGRQSLGILLMQDFAVIPMLVVLGLVTGKQPETAVLAKQLFGGIFVTGIAVLLALRGSFRLPDWALAARNHEFRFLVAALFCLGAAWFTTWLHLSPALGAFLAGMVLAGSDSGPEVRRFLDPFRMLFVALFFLSVGMLFDVGFLRAHWTTLVLMTLAAFVLGTLVIAGVLRLLGMDTITALVSGCLMAQVGEFSFLLAGVARKAKSIDASTHQMAVSVIVLTLIFTPFWLSVSRKIMRRSLGESGTQAFHAVDDGAGGHRE
jgi:CPA2 family monovalent cation:H+ antiporter-2